MVGLKIGIDLGTSTFRAYVEGKGIVLSEPSVIAIDMQDGSVAAVGRQAYEMIGKAPCAYRVIKPIEGGSVVDYDMAQLMLGIFFNKICKNKIFKPTVAACMPSGITSLEQRTLLQLFLNAGTGRICLFEQPLAAAIGAGVLLDKPFGTMIIDIGSGTTNLAVVTMGGTAVSYCIKTGSQLLNKNIIDYLRINRKVLIGEKTAEELKLQLGGAVRRQEEIAAVSRGKSVDDGMPFYFEVTANEINIAIKDSIENICKSVLSVLEITPPELLKDITESGIILSGAASRLYGLDKLISEYTSIKTMVVAQPDTVVVKGLGRALRNVEYLKRQGYIFKTFEDL